jgi:hypothetical protein
MNTETLLGALVESRKALVESQRAIDAMLLQHANTGNAEFTGEQSAMGRTSMSNGDRSMCVTTTISLAEFIFMKKGQ